MSSGTHNQQRPSRLSRAHLGFDDDNDDLDYSDQAGPSNPSRHMASSNRPYPTFQPDPRSGSTRSYPPYDDTHSYSRSAASPRHDPHPRPAGDRFSRPTRPRSRSPSPQPDKDVLAYIRAQKEQGAATSSKQELALAEQLKMEKFQHGAGKVKSRVQKEREADERKRKQAEQDAAKAYDEFVAAMGGDVEHGSSEQQAEGRSELRKPMGFVAAGGKAYVGSRLDAIKPAQPEPSIESDTNARPDQAASKAPLKRVNAAFGDDSDDDQASATTSRSPTHLRKEPQRKRHQAMSSFLTQLQTEQAERESRLSTLASSTNTSISTLLAHETLSKPGSRDLASDPLTTNICVLSLPPSVDERSMGEFFRAWGDVATVKIMWPRGEQRERLGGLTGFVAYMTRSDAEYAFKQADGVMWGGVRVKLSWGKAMPLPQRAMYSMSREGKRQQRRADDARQAGDSSSNSSGVPKLVIRHRPDGTSADDKRQSIRSCVENDYPQTQRLFIETVASRIRSSGAHFEHVLREREADNPRFGFLFEPDSTLHHYFRMCLDRHYVPTSLGLPEKEFDDIGSDDLYSTDSGEESETQRTRSGSSTSSSPRLGTLARRRLCSMLRGLTLRRERIARITAFALDHASSYPCVVSILTASLLRPSTPIPRKLARLYALSDILHNSGTPVSNAWRYRASVESQLPLVFVHLGQVAASFTGKLKRQEFKDRVTRVLDVWEGWIVVSPHVLERLRRLFERPPAVKAAVTVGTEDEDVDGEALDTAQAAHASDDEDLDGEAL